MRMNQMMNPKSIAFHLAAAALAWAFAGTAAAQLTIPSDGSDGEFRPTQSVVIDLAQAVDGNWDADNSANAGRGIYDKNQWSVVFKYSSVTIPAGVTVSFTNHPSRAPVVWLVQGDVTIIGPGNGAGVAAALNLNGQPAVPDDGSEVPPEGGPGGGRGGAASLIGYGAGLGIGGGATDFYGGSGRYQGAYGNPRIVPIIGGSGAGANGGRSGSGSGGAILIASSGNATVSGKIHALSGSHAGNNSREGSGGAIRLIANSILGSGEIRATNFTDGTLPGRIRLEASTLSTDLSILPETFAVPPGAVPVIWPPSNAPKVRILSVAAAPAPDEPTANLTTGADIGIQNDDAVEVLLETTNFPIEGLVQVRKAEKFGAFQWHTATYASGNNARATWSVQAAFAPGFSTLQARATAP